MATLAADSTTRQQQRPARHRIEDDLLEILQADEGMARNLEIVVDEGHPDENSSG